MAQSTTSDCATILKRGYLLDKKAGLLERRRWYVLRQDLAQGYCLLEFYRDEKSASKKESPKGFINVHDIVEVQRVPDKKQTFEILCPGLGYRLMANSEVETDEWMEALKKLILYRKGNTPLVSHSQPLAITHPSDHRQLHPQSLPMHTTSPHHTSPLADFPLSHSPTCILHSLPTPPESVASPPNPVIQLPIPIQRQRSSEFVPPLPSPSTSSDSSSMCSGSNASVEIQQLSDGDAESRTRFRVHVKENSALNVTGPADLVISEDCISLHSVKTGEQLISWPIGALRKYGVNNVCFTILTGRFCDTGEGRFQFYTSQSRLIHSKVHAIATQKASAKSQSTRRGSEPIMPTTEKPQQQSQTLTSHGFGLSPPSSHYTHIDHALRPPTSQEPYSQIGHARAATLPASLSPGYDKLNHHHLYNHSASPTNPISLQQQQPQGQMPPTLPFRRPCTCQQTGNPHGVQHVIGQTPCLSTAPCQSRVSLTSSLPHTLSHSAVAAHSPGGFHHHPPAAGGHLDPWGGVHQNPPGMHGNPPLNVTGKTRSGELSCPDFHRYWEGEGPPRPNMMRSRSITSSTLC